VELGTVERQGGSCHRARESEQIHSELEVAPRSWDGYRAGARGGRRVARPLWTPTRVRLLQRRCIVRPAAPPGPLASHWAGGACF